LPHATFASYEDSAQHNLHSRRIATPSGLAGEIAQPCFSPHTNRGKKF
jgi:hypothetical protein